MDCFTKALASKTVVSETKAVDYHRFCNNDNANNLSYPIIKTRYGSGDDNIHAEEKLQDLRLNHKKPSRFKHIQTKVLASFYPVFFSHLLAQHKTKMPEQLFLDWLK